MSSKSPKKTSPKRKVRKAPNGGTLLSGNPGNKGGTGRPPDEFKRKMAELASSDEALAYLERCLAGEEGGQVAVAAHKYVAERGYGKPDQPVTLGGKAELRVVVVHE